MLDKRKKKKRRYGKNSLKTKCKFYFKPSCFKNHVLVVVKSHEICPFSCSHLKRGRETFSLPKRVWPNGNVTNEVCVASLKRIGAVIWGNIWNPVAIPKYIKSRQ